MAQGVPYEPTAAEADLLLEATKGALADAGALGGSIGSMPGDFGAARAGAAGGRFGARFTRPRSAEAVVEVPDGAEVVRERARRCIGEHGQLIEDPNGGGDDAVWGVVGSGAFDMVPALVRVGVEPTGGGCRVLLRATGREGLIKQRIAAKAVDRLREAVQAR